MRIFGDWMERKYDENLGTVSYGQAENETLTNTEEGGEREGTKNCIYDRDRLVSSGQGRAVTVNPAGTFGDTRLNQPVST